MRFLPCFYLILTTFWLKTGVFHIRLSDHLPAGVCAFPAHFRAVFAVFIVVLFTFNRAAVANFGAEPAGILGIYTTQAHELRRRGAHGSAFHIGLNTGGHHGHIVFFQIHARAMQAKRGAFIANLNTAFVIVVIFHSTAPSTFLPGALRLL
jgi:hypothetical protein